MSIRRRYLSKPLLNLYRRAMPAMSRTEKEALSAGTVGWEGELFSGNPNWEKLSAISLLSLTAEEKAFIEGPLETLCSQIDDWQITHELVDLPPPIWKFIREQGFFGLMIPKEYGGKGFSNYACSQIQIKIEARSVTLGTTISVPNSLGPAELLLHYGTEEQKNYYLPRLASGKEIPCFALTSPDAGSDATSMLDTGIVCEQNFEGQVTRGIRLNFNKRYITLAPIATVIGLAFKLYDPDHLLGNEEELGITCALIPRDTPGLSIGRRHFPLNAPFQNGPIQGRDVFIPLDWLIGGPKQAGQGWRMLMECLSGGRGLSLPALVTGGAEAAVLATSAYARVRKQFKLPIIRFEGIGEVVARMAGHLYTMEASRLFMLSALDRGEKPAVASAILKYQTTEKGRLIGNDAMDVHGGKGIILGPLNYLGRAYEAIPIAITVEGANILTRNMIIFGQGVMRCHPYILAELEAALQEDKEKRLNDFDRAFWAHVRFTLVNCGRAVYRGLTAAFFVHAPQSKLKYYYQKASRMSSAFALLSDVALLVYGGKLKRKESISARLGDILSQLYMVSAILHFYRQREDEAELPLAQYALETCFYEIQQAIDQVLKNFASRFIAVLLKFIIFPWGKRFSPPRFSLSEKVLDLFSTPTSIRSMLTADILIHQPDDIFSQLEAAFQKVCLAEPVERNIDKKLASSARCGKALDLALERGIISAEEHALCLEAESLRQKIIAVDDFSSKELVR